MTINPIFTQDSHHMVSPFSISTNQVNFVVNWKHASEQFLLVLMNLAIRPQHIIREFLWE